MTADPANPDPSTQAAELALGLLDGEERANALRRILADPDFAREFAWWRDQFSDLLDEYPSVPPRGDLLPHVGDEPPKPLPSFPPRKWRWFATGLAGGALAASLAMAVLLPRTPSPVPADPMPLIAVLVPPVSGGQPPVAAWLARGDGSLRLTDDIAVPRNRSAELWVIGSDKVPHALGLLSPSNKSLIGSATHLKPGDTLAISIEPQGGSRTGAPTGPVIVSGTMTSA